LTQVEQKVELLAPAGNIACLKAACMAGADAIYLSGKRFGARAFAANFDERSLRWARRVTASLQKKLYVTLNTIVFENEWPLLEQTLDFYETLQPDALIIQDLGVAWELKKRNSTIPRHLSTQGAWFGVGGLQELQELGISRVILPRELSLDEIKSIVERFPDLEFEMFVHGAMCYSISGHCYWSIALGTRSGNRGTCAQPCRREYGENGHLHQHLFSPKDLRLIDELDRISDAGLASIKIEGRMKTPEYVFQVVSAYRAALDKGEKRVNNLDEVFSRASNRGFIDGQVSPQEWRTADNPGREGVVIGRASGECRDGLTGVIANKSIKPGEGIFWYDKGQKRGTRITWVKMDRKNPELIWVRGIGGTLKKGTELRRTSSGTENIWEKDWKKEWERRPIDLFWSGRDGLPLAVEAVINGYPLRIETDEKLQLALNEGLEKGHLQEKFEVLGENFRAGKQVVSLLGTGLHISAGTLKKMKRALVETLCKLELMPPPKPLPAGILAMLPEKKPSPTDFSHLFANDAEPELYLRVWNQSFPFVRDVGPDCWVLPWKGDKSRASQIIHSRVAWWLPPVINQQQFQQLVTELEGLEAGEFFCSGWEVFDLIRLFPQLDFRVDWSFNLCNLNALDFIDRRNLLGVFSPEWKEEEVADNLRGFRPVPAWNPLVSWSRFKDAQKAGMVVQNSHNDHFFSMPLGNGINGLFLVDKPASLVVKGTTSLLLDIAVAPNENPVQTAKDLNRIVESFKANQIKP
jgi:collagenase-like PrtC family protease